MFWLKSCLRCRGDLSGNFDVYGSYIYCIQCGHYLTEAEEANLRFELPQGGTALIPPVVHVKNPHLIAV